MIIQSPENSLGQQNQVKYKIQNFFFVPVLPIVKVKQFQNEFMKFLLKDEQKIFRISAQCSEGRNLDNFLFVFWGETMTS